MSVDKLARPGTWSDQSDKSLPGRRFPCGRCRPIDFSVESLYCVCAHHACDGRVISCDGCEEDDNLRV